MGYYPGVGTHLKAIPIEIHEDEDVDDLHFTVMLEPLYAVSFRIVTTDGSPPPLDRLGISIDSADRDALAYHLRQNGHEDGYYYAGYVPAGHYKVQTYVQWNFSPEEVAPKPLKWQMAKQELDIRSGSQIVLKLSPVK